MLGVTSTIDWGAVIAAVLPSVFSIAAVVVGALIHRQIRTPSGKPLGEVAEYAHDTAIANNLLLSKQNGPTKAVDAETIRTESATPPRVSVTPPPPVQE